MYELIKGCGNEKVPKLFFHVKKFIERGILQKYRLRKLIFQEFYGTVLFVLTRIGKIAILLIRTLIITVIISNIFLQFCLKKFASERSRPYGRDHRSGLHAAEKH